MLKVPVAVWLHTLKAYERHISAAAMGGGFIFDNFAYKRVDHPVTQTLLIAYLGVAALSIILLHWLEAHEAWQSRFVRNLRSYLPALTQFVLGNLWSAFLVFYARSGTIAASWPFLIVLGAIFLGNEVFKGYHARLVFTTMLFFFALISYAAFMVPVFVHAIGQTVFLLSGVAAVLVFCGFIWILGKLGVAQLGEVKWQIAVGACAVYAVINGLYFLEVLPPLPLALQKSGVYQSICRVPARDGGQVRCVGRPLADNLGYDGTLHYRAMEEPQPWTFWFGAPPVVHIEKGGPVVVFGAVFAPIALNTTTYHVWQRYDDEHGAWRTVQRVDQSLHGGRDKGYRAYSYKSNPAPGLWRVDFQTIDGRLIGRTTFKVERGQMSKAPAPVTL
jgi:hypothetical protein